MPFGVCSSAILSFHSVSINRTEYFNSKYPNRTFRNCKRRSRRRSLQKSKRSASIASTTRDISGSGGSISSSEASVSILPPSSKAEKARETKTLMNSIRISTAHATTLPCPPCAVELAPRHAYIQRIHVTSLSGFAQLKSTCQDEEFFFVPKSFSEAEPWLFLFVGDAAATCLELCYGDAELFRGQFARSDCCVGPAPQVQMPASRLSHLGGFKRLLLSERGS